MRVAGQTGKQARWMLWHWIMATRAPGSATRQAMQRQVSACCSAMRFDCLQRVRRTGRLEAAGAAEPRAEEKTVAAHEPHQHDSGQARQLRDERCVHASGPCGRHGGAEQHLELVVRGALQCIRRGARKPALVERRPQSDHPESAGQRTGVAFDGASNLPLQQRTGHRTACVPLGNDGACPELVRRVIHRLVRFWCTAC